MGRTRLGLCATLLLIGGGATAQDAPRVSRDRLAVLGTVGDLPPEGERVVAELCPGSAPGQPASLSVNGRLLDLQGFKRVLLERSEGMRDEAPPRASRLHVVLRVDRDNRWQDVQWLMQTCGDPEVRIFRILFAAVPEDGGAEGAMATYLPVDVGLARPETPAASTSQENAPFSLPIKLRTASSTGAAPGRAVYARLDALLRGAKRRVAVATVDADPWVSAGAVLETVDALLRWGAGGIVFRGAPLRTRPGDPGAANEVQARPRVLIIDEPVGPPAPTDPVPPAVARVRGALAGQVVAPAPVAEVAVAITEGKDGNAAVTLLDRASGIHGSRRGGHGGLDAEGGTGTEDAVEAGLEWLRRHQSPDGRWDADGFETLCREPKCGSPGNALYDPGVTALALLAFLGYGETHRTPRYGPVVRGALKYLKSMQDGEGCFGPRTSGHFTYNHALATLAMAEIYGLTQSPLFLSSAQKGVDFILHAQNPGMGWRYGVRPRDNDTSVTAWMVAALASARDAGLRVDPVGFAGATAWLDSVTDPKWGRAGYSRAGNGPARPEELMDRFPTEKSESLTAMAIFSRNRMGAAVDHPAVRNGTELLLRCLPSRAEGAIDFDYWHFGTLAMFQVGGDGWRKWNEAVRGALLPSQRPVGDGERRGSWDPVDPWGADGGRVYSTAINTLTLETYYRYARAWGGK